MRLLSLPKNQKYACIPKGTMVIFVTQEDGCSKNFGYFFGLIWSSSECMKDHVFLCPFKLVYVMPLSRRSKVST